MLLGINQTTGHPSAPWILPSHQSIPVLFGITQVTGHPNALWIQPTHWSILVLLGLNQVTGHPSAPWILPSHQLVGVVPLHCTHLKCSLHFSAYILAMQNMVSAFIQHPFEYPSTL
jgi:hypothetical protein